MKTLKRWEDLKPYGIDVLTGEACAYNYRLLCDITPAGVALFNAVFGLQLQVKESLPEGWNNRKARSIMLPRAMFEPLAVFALFTVSNCRKVYITYDGTIHGIESTDTDEQVRNFVEWNQGHLCESCQRYGADGGINLQYSNPGYSRNQHQMSGRVE
jgi:hypothetical protein